MVTDNPTLTRPDPLEPSVIDGHRVRLGDLTFDLAHRTIAGRNTEVATLSRNEFVVLATLVKSVGRFVAEDTLLQAIAGGELYPPAGIVHTYVKYLRHRLVEVGSSATIDSSPTEGVRLVP